MCKRVCESRELDKSAQQFQRAASKNQLAPKKIRPSRSSLDCTWIFYSTMHRFQWLYFPIIQILTFHAFQKIFNIRNDNHFQRFDCFLRRYMCNFYQRISISRIFVFWELFEMVENDHFMSYSLWEFFLVTTLCTNQNENEN